MTNFLTTQSCAVVTGASGRVGRALRAVWGGQVAGMPVQWSARGPGQEIDLVWNIGTDQPPALPKAAIFLHLAGQTRGTAEALAENRHSARSLCIAAQKAGARHVFFMSSVAVYRPGADLIDEDQRPDPVSDYGRAKLAAEETVQDLALACGLTMLRLGNLAGADTMLTSARQGPVTLDPIEGQPGGPERSYIGPQTLAAVVAALIAQAASGKTLPKVLNLAQHPALPMADLLKASGAAWRFGPPRVEAVPRVAVSVARLAGRVTLPEATAAGVIADLNSLKGLWP